jgi:hypothetical protein
MIDPMKQAVLERLAAIFALGDEARFGQLVAFLPEYSHQQARPRLADMEDEELLSALEEHHGNLVTRQVSIDDAHARA